MGRRLLINGPFVDVYISSLAPGPRRRLRTAIRALASSDRPPGLDVKPLDAMDGIRFWRLRVRVHRIVFSVQGDVLRIHRAFHRADGYGWLERR